MIRFFLSVGAKNSLCYDTLVKFKVEHLFKNVTIQAYEQLYFDEKFNISLCQAVNLERELVHRNIENNILQRSTKVRPKRTLPRPVAAVMGTAKIEYTENISYALGSHQGTWQTISGVLSDKIESKGTVQFIDRPDGVIRIIEGEIRVKIFGVGSMVEKLIVADVEKSYAEAASFTQKWLDEHSV